MTTTRRLPDIDPGSFSVVVERSVSLALHFAGGPLPFGAGHTHPRSVPVTPAPRRSVTVRAVSVLRDGSRR